MSQLVTTKLGRFRRVHLGNGDPAWLLECPGCGGWLTLSEDQFSGRVSADHASDGCTGGYHETHDYGAELLATMMARREKGESPLDPEPSR
jgi:hypothetical protein